MTPPRPTVPPPDPAPRPAPTPPDPPRDLGPRPRGPDPAPLLADLLADLPAPAAAQLRRGVAAVARDPLSTLDEPGLDVRIAECDRRLAAQLDALLHHPRVQALEAAWRGLWRLALRFAGADEIRLELLHCTKDDLRADFAEAPELPRSGLYYHVYAAAIGTFGADPYGLLCADLEFGPGAEDVVLLRQCAAVAAMAHAPFIANAAPEFFDRPDFADLPRLRDLAGAMAHPRMRAWQAFRATEDARYVGLCLPRVLLRAPHDVDLDPTSPLAYREAVARRADLLWGRASYAFALLAADSFARHRWCVHLLGSRAAARNHQLRWDYPTLRGIWPRPPLECTLTGRLEHALAEEGFISLMYERATGCARLLSAPSAQRPRTVVAGDDVARAAAAGERLGAQLPYIFLVSRLAHYLKCVQRERVGAWLDRAALARELELWLRQYVSDADDVQLEVRARRPLRRAAVAVEAVPGQAGWYRCRLQLQPHLTHNSASFTLSLSGKLDRPGGDTTGP